MGCCESQNESKPKKVYPKKPTDEAEIQIRKYSSKNYKYFKDVEGKKYNYFLDIYFVDLAYALKFYSTDRATVTENYNSALQNLFNDDNSKFYEPFSEDDFHVFLDNKVRKHSANYNKQANSPESFQLFREYFINVYKALLMKLEKEDEEKQKEDENFQRKTNRIEKYNILPILIFFCKEPFISKIKLIFEVFASENILVITDEIQDFFLSMFLLAAYCELDARNKIENEAFNKMEKAEVKQILDAMQMRDSQNLVKETCRRIFGEDSQKELTYTQFKALFNQGDDGIDYILTAEGVRHFQELYNV